MEERKQIQHTDEALDTLVGADTQEAECTAAPSLGLRIVSLLHRIKKVLPTVAIYARYFLPTLSIVVLFVMGLFYNIAAVTGGGFYNVALWKLHINTITGTHRYLGGEQAEAKTWFYGLMSAGAIVSLLVYAIAIFLALLALYTSLRAFHAGHENEQANRYKVAFKIAFPNRIWFFVSNLLVLVPAAFPHFVSFLGSRFLAIGAEDPLFVRFNRPLFVVGILVAVTLVLAFVIPRFERRRKLNMFLVWHAPEEGETEEIAENDEE